MSTDKIEREDFEKVDPEYQELLRRILAIQADCEIGGPHLYVEHMLPAAPTKLDQLIVARTAAEEAAMIRGGRGVPAQPGGMAGQAPLSWRISS